LPKGGGNFNKTALGKQYKNNVRQMKKLKILPQKLRAAKRKWQKIVARLSQKAIYRSSTLNRATVCKAVKATIFLQIDWVEFQLLRFGTLDDTLFNPNY
jgi:hypothetical protein